MDGWYEVWIFVLVRDADRVLRKSPCERGDMYGASQCVVINRSYIKVSVREGGGVHICGVDQETISTVGTMDQHHANSGVDDEALPLWGIIKGGQNFDCQEQNEIVIRIGMLQDEWCQYFDTVKYLTHRWCGLAVYMALRDFERVSVVSWVVEHLASWCEPCARRSVTVNGEFGVF
jgi:hypothetical protein